MKKYSGFQMKTKPWAHQLKALEFLYNRDRGALYTVPGSGKTKVMIDLIVNKGFRVVLIACTNKGCEVWEKQFQIHSQFRPEMVINLSGVPTPKKVLTVTKKLSELRSTPSSEKSF